MRLSSSSFLLFLVLCCLWWSSSIVVLATNNGSINIWPKPYSYQIDGTSTVLIPDHRAFQFDQGNVPSGEAKAILDSAIQRYTNLIFYDKQVPAHGSSVLCGKSNYVCIDGIKFTFDPNTVKNVNLDLATDERYVLSLDKAVVGNRGVVNVYANSVFGALRALESFAQLVVIEEQNDDANAQYYTLTIEAPFTINDKPRFPWRGLLIDSSRHYLPLRKIVKILGAMQSVKMNVLHWHIVDAQSFPLHVPTAPNLIKGAYSPKATYQLEDVQYIVKTARGMGIRVVIELDMPGHAASWGIGYPEIVAKCPKYSANVNNIPFDPTNEKTFEIIEAVVAALVQVVPDSFMHFGADEVVQGCWKEDPTISAWMQKKGWTDYNLLLAYFETRLQAIYTKYQRTMVAWEELMLEHNDVYKVPSDSVIQAWRSKQALGKIIGAGYRAIASFGLYLDRQVPGNQTHSLWGDTWQDFYTADPTAGMNFSPEQESRVLGTEACQWAEQTDASSIETRIFPRVLGAAERAWSQAKDTQDIKEATNRLSFARCHVLVRRGIQAGPIRPDYCDAVEQFY